MFVPANGAPNTWTDIDATTSGQWGLTGAAGTATGCSLSGSLCSFSAIQAALADGGADATIYTVAINKGKDYAFSGAVDALVINNQTFDFEPFGVYVTAS